MPMIMDAVALRSSPGPKTGCSTYVRVESFGKPCSCDPHPARRPGAAPTPTATGLRLRCCDPHSVRGPGAARPRPGRGSVRGALRPSLGPRTGCSLIAVATAIVKDRLRSSPGPKTGCSDARPGPFGRAAPGCDPHPVRRPGAAPRHLGHPRPRPGCCDPHPVRRPGAATGVEGAGRGASMCCDPHPVRRPGAAVWASHAAGTRRTVAILTRSEDRVQRARGAGGGPPGTVAILTRSEDRVQRRQTPATPRACARCDPHPVRRPGAALPPPDNADALDLLRSSPGPKTGCSMRR